MENDWLAERDRARRVRKQQHAKLQLLAVFLCLTLGLVWVWWESQQPKPTVPTTEARSEVPVVLEVPVSPAEANPQLHPPEVPVVAPVEKSTPTPAVTANPVEAAIRDAGGASISIRPDSTSPAGEEKSEVPTEVEAKAVLDAFVSATSLEAKVGLVIRKPGLEDRVKAHYVDGRRPDPSVGVVMSTARMASGGRSFRGLKFECKSSPSGVGYAFFIRDSDGEVRLDWESFVGHGTMDWLAFQKSRTSEEVILRAHVSVDDYFNYEFTDAARYLSFRLKSADGKVSINGFTLRDSAVAIALEKALETAAREKTPASLASGRVWAPLVVKVQFPPEANSDHCVLLTRLMDDKWLLASGVVE